jgi:hypothetical protein
MEVEECCLPGFLFCWNLKGFEAKGIFEMG